MTLMITVIAGAAAVPQQPLPAHAIRHGGFGRPMVTGLARATAVTSRASGGKTVSAFLAR
ncbi:hypothetical protein ACH4PW_02700 [Streptomyces sp. NPDC017082]|uniref:hypothetical protein n=1 Tax=Streptomyces sp. NPDC017082 TaxID=3364974 RepID=UPI00379845E9